MAFSAPTGATWTAVTAPSGFGSSVDAVSCPTVAFCMIGGAGPGPLASSLPLSSVSIDGGLTWTTPIEVGNSPSGLRAVACINAERCIGLNRSGGTNSLGTGMPYVTDNGGRSWAAAGPSEIGTAASCAGMFCISVGGAFQVASDTITDTVFVSTNGGQSWT
jgi:hypothetical protein